MPWTCELQAEVRSLPPDPDPLRWVVVALDRTPAGAALDAEFAAFDAATQALVCAHGRWDGWHPERIARLIVEGPEAVDGAWFTLARAGWLELDGDGTGWSLAARAWRRARLRPSASLREAAARQAEADFHEARAHAEYAPARLVASLEAWETWGPEVPEVAEWARLHRRELAPEHAHPRTAVWAWIHRARKAQSVGQRIEARRCRDHAAALPQTPSSAVLIALIDVWELLLAGDDVEPALARLGELASTPFDRLLHLFVLAVAQSDAADPAVADTVAAGVHLAHEAGIAHMEVHFLQFSASHWRPRDLARAGRFLDAVERVPVTLTGRVLQEHLVQRGIQARCEGDLEGAIAHLDACLDVISRSQDKLMEPRCQALRAGYLHQTGRLEQSSQALVAAQVLLAGTAHEDHLAWAEAVVGGRSGIDPRGPHLTPPFQVDIEGRWFTHGLRVVDLTHQPVSAALLRALAAGPASADTLIEAAWPGDRSSPISLKNRLHSAVRALRQRGLGDALGFEDGLYRLTGYARVASAGEGDRAGGDVPGVVGPGDRTVGEQVPGEGFVDEQVQGEGVARLTAGRGERAGEGVARALHGG